MSNSVCMAVIVSWVGIATLSAQPTMNGQASLTSTQQRIVVIAASFLHSLSDRVCLSVSQS